MRKTVKAVVVNREGKYGFVTNPIHDCILLPGGGAETEGLEREIIRECAEEMFARVSVVGMVGMAHEYRNRNGKEYETTCFVVMVEEILDQDARTEDEKKNKLHPVWLGKEEAIRTFSEQRKKVRKGEMGFYNTAFNTLRDERFFLEYLKQNEKNSLPHE